MRRGRNKYTVWEVEEKKVPRLTSTRTYQVTGQLVGALLVVLQRSQFSLKNLEKTIGNSHKVPRLRTVHRARPDYNVMENSLQVTMFKRFIGQ